VPVEVLVGIVGLLGAFTAALVGSGSGLVMVSFLLYLPPLLGLPSIDVKTAAALGPTQILFATLLGTALHGRRGLVDKRLVLSAGTAMAAAAVFAAILSAALPTRVLAVVFALLATAAGLVMFLPPAHKSDSGSAGDFSRLLAVLIGGGAGTVVGLVGAGTFLLTPAFLQVLRTPTRVAIGSTLGVSLLGGLAAVVGKLSTGQVPYALAVAVLVGTVPGVFLGAWASHRLPPKVLRYLLAVLITIIALRAWWGLLR